MNFDDPKPTREVRKQQLITLLPSLKASIDQRRGRLSRSEWIERAIVAALDDGNRPSDRSSDRPSSGPDAKTPSRNGGFGA